MCNVVVEQFALCTLGVVGKVLEHHAASLKHIVLVHGERLQQFILLSSAAVEALGVNLLEHRERCGVFTIGVQALALVNEPCLVVGLCCRRKAY